VSGAGSVSFWASGSAVFNVKNQNLTFCDRKSDQDPDPHWFGLLDLDPDPHKGEKLDPDPDLH
jgi:hypothetical protein